MTVPAWTCCQLGAREHYAVPRAVHRAGRLAGLLTDVWVPATMRGISGRWGQRSHVDLATAPVTSFTGSLLGHEALWRLQRLRGWDYFVARNRWFQTRAAASLRDLAHSNTAIVFAYSYAAREVFRAAKQRGWMTVLGQIDPGPEHYLIQERIISNSPEYKSLVQPPPSHYFESWREECALADRIVANSPWSRELLIRAGIPSAKISIIALPYEVPQAAAFTRRPPAAFSDARPLRALFVGTATLTKGVAEILEAIDQLGDAPIQLQLVGDVSITVPERFRRHPKIRWVGRVNRGTVMHYYRTSDVLLFPSHSDGFGMAQIEARAWSLPIVASRHCGQVVRDGETGIVLEHVSSHTVAAALRRLLDGPEQLAAFSERARRTDSVTFATFSDGLLALERP